MILAMIGLSAALASAPLASAAEMHDAVGVNVHVEYTDGNYRDLETVERCLNYLGVKRLRDAAPNPRNQGQANYASLAKAGFKFDLFVNGEDIDAAVKRLAALQARTPGAVEIIEGPNEINNHPRFTYAGEQDRHKAATLYQAALLTQIKANPVLANTPVATFTDYPATPGQADLANAHDYPPSWQPPVTELTHGRDEAVGVTPGVPFIVTELGFSTAANPKGVSEVAQARLILTSLLEEAAFGTRKTYLYELLDAYPDSVGSDLVKHYGLFDLQYRPKPAARAVRRFLQAYEDPAPAEASHLQGPTVTLRGAPKDVRTLVVRNSRGATIVAVWRTVAVYDPAASQDLSVTPEAVDIELKGAHGGIEILNPVAGLRGHVRSSAAVTRVMVAGDPLLVTIEPSAATT